jgi:hypothetical protein
MIKPFREVDRKDWYISDNKNRPDRLTAWHSEDFTVQVFTVAGGVVRLAINRNQQIFSPFLFEDGISQLDLQEIKQACGFGDWWGVEVYPPKSHILNIINVRHLWLIPQSPLPAGIMGENHFLGYRRSEDYIVSCYQIPDLADCLLIWRKSRLPTHDLAWDLIQEIKDAVDFQDRSAFELFPAQAELEVDAGANCRQLWLLPERFAFEWDVCSQTGKTLNTNWDSQHVTTTTNRTRSRTRSTTRPARFRRRGR